MDPRTVIQTIRILTLILVWSFVAPMAFAYLLPFKPFPKIEITGSNTLSYTYSQIDGSQSFYDDDNANLNGLTAQSSNLLINGELIKNLFFNAEVQANHNSPQPFRWSMRYAANQEKVMVGEFSANLPGNEFVTLNRSLLGVQVDTTFRHGSFSFLASELSSPVHTDSFYGQNISGPYYLTASPIVDGSEVVLVNDVKKERTKDYTLDYTSGILNFANGLIILPTDRVTVSYEVQSSGASGGGQLYGIRAAYPVLSNLNVGITHLQLEGNGQAASSETSERDTFLGNGTPGPFTLTYRPIVANSETVTVNGILVPSTTTTGTHPYTLDNPTGRLLFASGYEPPIDSTIIVRYSILNENTGSGSRNQGVTGVDANLALGNGLSFNVQAAQSASGTLNESQNGNTALGCSAGYMHDKFNVLMKFHQVDAGFTPLDTVGYQSVLQNFEWTAGYSPNDLVSFSTSGANTHEPLNPYGVNDPAASAVNSSSMEEHTRTFAVELHKTYWPSLTLRRTLYDTNQFGAGELGDATTTDNLSLAWARSIISGSLGLNHVTTNSRQQDTSSSTGGIVQYNGGTQGATFSLMLQPSDRFDVSTNMALNQTTAKLSNGQNNTTAQSMQLSSHFRATSQLSFNSSLSTNRTGDTESLTGTAIPGQVNTNMTLGSDWRPRKNLNIGLSYSENRAEGGTDASNSITNNYNSNLNWQPLDLLSLSAYFTRQELHYIGAVGDSLSNMIGANAEMGPFGKFKVSVDGQHLWGQTAVAVTNLSQTLGASLRALPSPFDTTQTTTTDSTVSGNTLTSMRAKVSYAIAPRQDVFLGGEITTNGGYPSQSYKDSANVGWDYKFGNNLTLTLNGGRVIYVDQANTSLNYAANQISSQLTWHF